VDYLERVPERYISKQQELSTCSGLQRRQPPRRWRNQLAMPDGIIRNDRADKLSQYIASHGRERELLGRKKGFFAEDAEQPVPSALQHRSDWYSGSQETQIPSKSTRQWH
jgi:hypothetical protein